MAIDEFKFYGKSEAELQNLSIEEFIKLIPARRRRTLKRGVMERHKPLLTKIKLAKEGKRKKPIKTHSRDMLVIPDMLGMTINPIMVSSISNPSS